ncbi:vWA domain-containing protein [Altibacter lentus]|uniref:vWA domain-containing protein n=1 Tax=Altibacter lentus TaxID=1223410 RepID=UPI00068C0BDF|nr:VWA domain-containing protein [Altibacter lentus]
MKLTTTLVCMCCFILFGHAQQQDAPSPIIFIYDASGSMWGQMQGKTKMEIASGVLSTAINELPENQEIGLVAYGHRKKGDCNDVETLLPMDNSSKTKVSSAVKTIKPLGMTPLAYSATTVIDQLRKTKKKATIILITDGIESCDGNICDVVKAAKMEGIDFKLHIVGFGLKANETEQLKCAANAGDGNYYDAADAGGLGDAMNEVVVQTVDKKEGNFGVYAVKNGVPIDSWVRAYSTDSKKEVAAVRTYGETRYMYLPPGKYDLIAQPLSSNVKAVTIKNVAVIDENKTERTISFDGGKIATNTTNNGEGWDTMVKIIDENGDVAASGRTYGRVKELEVNPGTYKVEIQALAMKGLDTYHEVDNITVTAGETTPIEHDFKTGSIQIYAKVGGEDIDSIVNIKEVNTGKGVDAGRTYDRGKEFLVNPGTYQIKIQPLGVHKDKNPQTITVELKKGQTITKSLNF